ncbi:MAG TPA: recombination mediator RecR [Nitrospiria bacterium]|nr:recombination mediator RecR [Nitrospiria bacterium]
MSLNGHDQSAAGADGTGGVGTKGVFAQLVDAFCQLPGVGPKTAQRYAFYLVKQSPDVGRRLADAITAVRERLGFCPHCHNLAELSPSGIICVICQQPRRDRSRIMVVEEPNVIQVIEKTGEYKGLYHVLQGAISPLDGVNPSQIKAAELLERVKQGGIEEVILATNPTMEGETTALYLAEQLKSVGVKITRIACGVPVGVDLEFTDEATMIRALQGRQTV